MVQIDKLLNSITHRTDVIFTSSYGDGSDIIYIPENGNISNFFNSQKLNTKATTDSITIPNRLTIAGKTIINNVAYTKMKAAPDFKGFDIHKTIQKLKGHNRTRYIDTSFFIKDIVSLAHTRSITGVLGDFFKFIFSSYNDIEALNNKGTKAFKGIKPQENETHEIQAKKELPGRLKILLIDADLNASTSGTSSTGFTKDFLYYLQIHKYQMNANLYGGSDLPDAIIYKIGSNYFPIGILEKFEDKTKNYVKINRIQLENVQKILASNSMDAISNSKKDNTQLDKILGFKDPKNIDAIIKVGDDLKKIQDKYTGSKLDDTQSNLAMTSEIKKYIEGNPLLSDLEGTTFQEKLQNLYYGMSHAEKLQAQRGVKNEVNPEEEEKLKEEHTSDSINEPTKKLISKLSEQEKVLVKKYNGTVFLDEMQERDNLGARAFNPDNIVQLTEFSGYKKQETEFQNNLDNAIEDLIGSLEKDKELGIKVLNIKSEIRDNNKTRFKRFTVQIQHPNFGDTFKGKYSFTMDVPYPVEGKYIKFGGNDYVMVNQLFNKPIQKVNNQLVRLYTHYNTTSVTLKNSKFNGVYGLQNLEKEIIVALRAWYTKQYPNAPFVMESFKDNEQTELFKNIPISRSAIAKFNYKTIGFSGVKLKWNLDFSKLLTDPNSDFYSFSNESVIERANFDYDAKEIVYTTNGDIRRFPIEHLDEFLMGMYNRISKIVLKRDSIKKSKTSTPYFGVKIIGYQCPVSILLASVIGFSKAMDKMDLKWTFQDKKIITKEKDQDQTGLGGEPINIQFQNGYVTIYPKTMKQRSLANGFLKYKVKTSTFNLGEMQNPFLSAMESDFGSYGVKKFLESIPKIIDNTTEKILKEYGYPTNILDLYSDTIPNMMLTREDSHFENLDYYRIRLSETISHIGYNQIQQALSELKRKKNFKDTQLFLKPEFIMSKLLEAGLFQNAKTINPIEEMMLSQKIVKTGIGNVKKSQVTLARRDLNQSYFGVISATATNEYGGIGSNQTLTNGTTIKDRFGTIKTKEYNNEDNPFNMLAPVESLTPFFEYDDTTRRIMGNQQTGQFTQLDNPDEPLVQTGFESYIPWLVSDRFTKKSRIHGKVSFVNNGMIMKITGTGPDIGKSQMVSLKHAKSRTKRGVYLLNKYTNLVSDGQNVKPNTILAATDSLKTGKLAVGKNLVVAEMPYNGMNYEDGWAITDAVTSKYSNKYLQKITMMIPGNVKVTKLNIAKNLVTKAGDVLLEFQKENYHIQNLNLDMEHEEDDDILYGLEQHRGTSKYFSPGGKILEIQVRLNNAKPDPKIKTLWDESIKDLNTLQSFCELQSKDIQDPKERNKAQMECLGNADGISSLSIGGHKMGGEEPETGIIEVYIERDNPISNGSKFTLGNSGGKGTVQYIIPTGKEPIAIESQLKIDFIPTSLSIIKRKNPSIIFNMYLGKCMFFINEMIKRMLKEKPDDITRIENFVLSCYEIIDRTSDTRILDEFKKFFKQDKSKIQKAINQSNSLQKPLFVGLVPAFSNKITMRDIVRLSKHIGIPLKERVLVKENVLGPDSEGTITMKKVPVGILNVFLLEHFPQTQGSVRGSMYVKRSIVTGQGQSGSKDRKGATKAGLYDLYSILTKTPYNLIKELHSLKSDAKTAKIAYDREIFTGNGVPSIKDIKISKHDTTTKNYIEALFLGAGIKTVY